MTYIVLEIQKNADGTVGSLVYSFTSRAEADRQFFLILAAAATSQVPVHSAVLLDESGMVLKSESYRHDDV